MGLWAAWPSKRCPCPRQESWTRWPLNFPSNENHWIILWFYDTVLLNLNSQHFICGENYYCGVHMLSSKRVVTMYHTDKRQLRKLLMSKVAYCSHFYVMFTYRQFSDCLKNKTKKTPKTKHTHTHTPVNCGALSRPTCPILDLSSLSVLYEANQYTKQ